MTEECKHAAFDIEDLPRCAKPHLIRVHLEPNVEYKWCSCGLSSEEPYCDGRSCIGTGFEPCVFRIEKAQTWHALCACKRTRNPPFCDGSHIYAEWAKPKPPKEPILPSSSPSSDPSLDKKDSPKTPESAALRSDVADGNES
ncbi:AgCISD_1 putative mitochondrial CDGSH iron-sulfur domain-containing protein [Andalucia godoyi]|uniref:AgCISD_1 putative mitochondrial CDGSH iron-sulfur domain-containing protein n=1 Tax=Andalucia godoyi TaxID=505711 RepID=A0A8K0F4G9_ANDGO|nr:AgCISD_1 putative mitochondrial CDGSH iron-sulfur domain-containing protein [Andalucia godoyi]|eukprot:ANDGO_04063.mRNA.1 AgCISD_1 putative mitochondrial CDGSH iron-sulfur domain-containing protein